MTRLYIVTIGFALLMLFSIRAVSQIDSLTDDDIVAIKMSAEHSFSDYQRIMNELANPRMLSIYRDSVIAESDEIFTEHAKIEVDYDSAYLPPHMPYEVDVEKYLGDFHTYFQKEDNKSRVNIYYTNRYISEVKWNEEDGFYYLTIQYTSIYDGLLPQKRVATFRAEKPDEQWQTKITYIKFKDLLKESDTSTDNPIAKAGEDTARQQAPKQEENRNTADQGASVGQISLNELADGGKKGKKYLISWQPPYDHPVSILLLPDEGEAQTIASSHVANRLAWTIDQDLKSGKYQIKVLDEQMMTSITSPQFRISSRFPLALKLAIGAGAGFYLVQTVRHDWNFAWPFGTSDTPEPVITEEPDLPGPPSAPE